MKAVIILGGEQPEAGLLRDCLAETDIVICADSGANWLMQAGRLPDLLVGDMDSIAEGLDKELETKGVRVLRRSAEKDETDGQLALDEAMALGADDITLLGAAGGRLDHLMGNLQLLVRAARRGIKAVMADKTSRAWAATGRTEILGRAGNTLSILPLGEGVSAAYLSGLKYGTLEPLALPMDCPVGVSNVMTEDTAVVEITGWALVVRVWCADNPISVPTTPRF